MWIASLRSTLVLAGAGICALHAVGQGCGTTVYDSGGSGGAYGNNQNLTYTYCAPPGQIMTINFTSFNTEAFYDELSIHAGPSNASPQIGIYSGTTLPGSYSTPPGGCLTLWFTSDGTVTAPGWAATLTCVPFVPPAGDCYYVLELTDSYGDGWGTSYVGVSINGGPYTNYSVTGSTFSVPIGVNIGDIIALNYNASGAWQGENAYTLSLGGTSVVFNSGTPPAAGISYATTVDCTPPPAPPQDCIGGVTICNSTAINNNSTNTGNVVDLNSSNQGCLSSQEQQGTWYFFSPNTTGTIGMTITPSGAVDYDFAIWGPLSSVSCPPSGPPLRCSYAYPPSAGTYLTGMANGYGDVSEAAGGIGVDGFVAPLTIGAAQVGQVYIMYIDNFDITGQAFSMDWNLSTPGMLDCTVLPVDLLDLRATRKERAVDVMWTTGSESGTERFVVQHSTNGTDFTPIGQLPAAGESQGAISYALEHPEPRFGINYYRLEQHDLDGSVSYSTTVQVAFAPDPHVILPRPNPASGKVEIDLPSGITGAFALSMLDASGRVVRRWDLNEPGGRSMAVSLEGIEAGCYVIDLRSNAGAVLGSGRIVVQ